MAYSVIRENRRTQKRKQYKNTKGNYEYYPRTERMRDGQEQTIKANCPTGSFNHTKIPELMNPTLSKEERLLKRKYSVVEIVLCQLLRFR